MSKEGGNEEAAPKGGGNEPMKKESSTDIYENRGSKKIIRLVTVLAYMFSVSFVAIVLSAYYLFLWEPPNPNLLKRPVHLSGDPEIQFLLSDPSIMSNHSDEFLTNNFHTKITADQGNFNASTKTFTGRIVGDTFDENNVTDSRGRVTKNFNNLNDSLTLLRIFLMDFLRNGSNDSKPDDDPSWKSWGTSNCTEYALLEKRKELNSTKNSSEKGAKFEANSKKVVENRTIYKGTLSSTIKNQERMIGDNGTPPTQDSSTISEDEETTKNRFTSARNSAMYGSYRDVDRLNRNLKGNHQEKRNKYIPASQVKVGTAITENSIKITREPVENVSKYSTNVEATRNDKLNSFSGGFIDNVKTTTIIDESDVIVTTTNKEDLEIGTIILYRLNGSTLAAHQDNCNSNMNTLYFKERKPRMQLPRKMSAQNVNPEKFNSDTTNVNNTAGNREHKGTGNEIRFAGDERKDKLYEPKHKQKLVRVLTVVAYVIFVSMGAILLSLYYTFLWDPKDVPVRNETRTKQECVDVKSSNPITTPSTINETLIERMTARFTENEQTPEPKIATIPETTQRQKDMLTILSESTEIYSSVSPATTSEDFRTDSNTTKSGETFTKNRSETTS
ncbi:uncharacterized protein LOC128879960 [Hylaeus volcanicus]|uniref:uncharacterized protein LOC128879960 n=1 Tax=Hylaeus volcanicus TaxID=313075 RepID=UPI0023B7818F|nr:uncharacterized protein LOC128879960 [Hylaeus volcanicus]